MDQVAELVERCRTEDEDAQVDLIVELEDHVADPRVLDLLVSIIADAGAYDLSRIECVKILRLWPPEQPADRVRVGHVIAAALRDEDDLVRQYAAMALGPYADDPIVLDALTTALAPDEDDVNVRHNALSSVMEAGRGEHTITLLRQLADDPELGTAATRTLREWT
ncbi:HEAT repeat domain-containing protein [Actinophytocola sp.]|uniref:HEAT repeat domain-containing protein n=1 Tax=Actinophytocola sp. TaxID=1872138 RepID=UPI002ED01B6F